MVQVKLLLKEKLDRESESEYRMQLFAVDGGADAMTGTAMVTVFVVSDVMNEAINDICVSMVTVYVVDVNDNRPRFSKPLYEVLTTAGTRAFRVRTASALLKNSALGALLE